MNTQPLDPRHRCWWTNHRQMDIHWNARSHEWQSAGVSVPAVLEACRAMPLRWWSRRYGAYSDSVIAFAAPITASIPCTPYTETGPLTKLCGTWRDEAQIDVRCCAALGVALASDDDDDDDATARAMTALAEQRPAPITLLLTAHDDCFVSLWPVDAAMLPALIQCCLRVQQFYSQRRPASDASEQVLALLDQYGHVELLGSNQPPYLLARSETQPARIFRKARHVARPLDEPNH